MFINQKKTVKLDPLSESVAIAQGDMVGDNIFLFKDMSMGFACRLCLPCDDAMSAEEFENMVNNLKSSVLEIVKNDYTYFSSSPVVQIINSKWEDALIYPSCKDNIKPFLNNFIESHYSEAIPGNRCLTEELLITFRFFPVYKRNIIDEFKFIFLRNNTLDDIKERKKEILKARSILKGRFTSSECLDLTEKEIVKYYNKRLNPLNLEVVDTISPFCFTDSLYTDILWNNDEDKFCIKSDGRYFYKVFNIYDIQLSQLGALKEFLSSLEIFKFDFTVGLSGFTFEDDLNFTLGELLMESSDYSDFKNSTSVNNPSLKQSIKLKILMFEKDYSGYILRFSQDILRVRCEPELQIPFHTFMSSLPLNSTQDENEIYRRHKTTHLNNSIDMWPLYCPPKDVSGEIHAFSSSGAPFLLSLYEGGTDVNKMSVGFGPTRNGKSSDTSNEIIKFLYNYPESYIVILDKKTSYSKLCDQLDGQMIYFNNESCDCVFSALEPSEDDVSFMTDIVCIAFFLTNENCEINSTHRLILKESIKHSFINSLEMKEVNGEYLHPTWDNIVSNFSNVCDILESINIKDTYSHVDDLIKWSLLFRKGEKLEKFFNIQTPLSGLNEFNKFTIYDFDSLKDDTVRTIASYYVSNKILKIFSSLPRHIKKGIIFEEFGDMIRGEENCQGIASIYSNFVSSIVATYAKENVHAHFNSNAIEDFTKKTGKLVWDMAAIKNIYPLGTEKMKSEFLRTLGVSFTEAEKDLINYLHLNKQGRYSFKFVKSNNKDAPFTGILKLPFTYSLEAISSSGNIDDIYKDLRLSHNKSDSFTLLKEGIQNEIFCH